MENKDTADQGAQAQDAAGQEDAGQVVVDSQAGLPSAFEAVSAALDPQPVRERLLGIEAIARLCHANNRAYCQAIGENNILGAWEDLTQELRDSIMLGVEKHIENPTITPEQSHELWMASKAAQGYRYGPVRDEAQKLHPCMLPYRDLPATQQAKDYLFGSLVRAAAGL